MEQLLTTNLSLGVFAIFEIEYEYMDCIWDGIEKGLYSSRNRKGNMRIKLKFGNGGDTTPKSSDILIKIYRIMMQLKSSNLDNFMFVAIMLDNVDPEWEQQKHIFYKRHKTDFWVEYGVKNYWAILVTNNHCKICGSGHVSSWRITHY